MSCFHPKKAIRYTESRYGKPGTIRFISDFEADSFRPHYSKYGSSDLVQIPCGKCVGCLLSYSRDWANRCLLEMLDSPAAYFLTLTYDDQFLPRTFTADADTGEVVAPAATLQPRDMTLALKRMRKYLGDHSFRYLYCGEYGDQTLRPHYHMLYFGQPVNDLYPWSQSQLGDQYYRSDFFERVWTDPETQIPIGNVTVAPANWQTAAYVARYVLKKKTGNFGRQCYDDLNIVPPYIRMSRNPGLGRRYLDSHPDLFRFSQIHVGTVDGQRSMPIPNYFRRVFKEHDPVSADWLSIERKTIAENSSEIVQKLLTDKDIYDILKDDERRIIDKANRLKRIL